MFDMIFFFFYSLGFYILKLIKLRSHFFKNDPLRTYASLNENLFHDDKEARHEAEGRLYSRIYFLFNLSIF